MGYSTRTVIVIDVTIIGIEVGIVIEIIQPRRPPNAIALDADNAQKIRKISYFCAEMK